MDAKKCFITYLTERNIHYEEDAYGPLLLRGGPVNI